MIPGQTDWTLRNWLRRHIYVSETQPQGYMVNTARFATLAPQIPVESYIEATAFARELRRLAERFPALLPERSRTTG
jgi:hypothetical protein